MVVYLDTAFALNALADALGLYAAAALSGVRLSRRRLLLTAGAGGLYGVVCLLPGCGPLAGFLPQMAVAGLLVRGAFGAHKYLPRLFLLFFLLSCTLAGAFLYLLGLVGEGKPGAWGAFLAAAGGCWVLTGGALRGGARHMAAGQLCRGSIRLRGRSAPLTVLHDTGHTLTDRSGAPVLTVWSGALEELWTPQERDVLGRLEEKGPLWCLERLPGRFSLLPYRAVGVERGVLLCFRAERVELEGRCLGAVTVALSPWAAPEGFNALWGGDRGKEKRHAAQLHQRTGGAAAGVGPAAAGDHFLHRGQRHPAAPSAAGGGGAASGLSGQRRAVGQTGAH